jgi:tRNA nucleotidyltransferase (CCA-adding enzyme)
VLQIAETVAEAGGRAWLVGGSVRDHLMGKSVKDWDIEVYGLDADALERQLRKVGRVDTVGKSFAVFKLRRRKVEFDVSIPRRDSKKGPGHKGIEAVGDPDMTVEEAVTRRDLTINAILMDPLTEQIVDPSAGQADLEARRLAPVDVTTFLEDPLRALRAVQFAARFGFEPTAELVRLCSEADLHELPPERVSGEWEKLLLRGQHIAHGLRLARQSAILARVFPEVQAGVPEATDALLDAARPLRDTLEDAPRQMALMLAVWLHALDTQDAEATLDRLRVHKWQGYALRDSVLALHGHHDDPVATDADLRWLSTRAEVDLALRVREVLGDAEAVERRAYAAALGVAHKAPKRLLEGRHLHELGVAPGPQMGVLVMQVYEAQLDGTVQTHEEAVAYASGLLGS